jgi:hypothetical protein
VDPNARRATVEPGCTSPTDAVPQACSLATPGHQLDDGCGWPDSRRGFGWLSRKFGMTIDNLIPRIWTAEGSGAYQ